MRADATKIEEYVPKVTPTKRARVKFFIVSPPKRKMARSVIMTVSEVLIDLAIVSLRL